MPPRKGVADLLSELKAQVLPHEGILVTAVVDIYDKCGKINFAL